MLGAHCHAPGQRLIALRRAVALLFGERLAGIAAALSLAVELRTWGEVDLAVRVVLDNIALFAELRGGRLVTEFLRVGMGRRRQRYRKADREHELLEHGYALQAEEAA